MVWKIRAIQVSTAAAKEPILVHSENVPTKNPITAKNMVMMVNGHMNRDVM